MLLLQSSFIFLESGLVSEKTTQSVLNKSSFCFVVSALTFYAFGFGFAEKAYGGIVGAENFFAKDLQNITILKLIYLFTSLQVSTSIMTQSLLERTHLDTYVALTIVYSAIGWPIAHSWIAGGGWL